MIRRVVLLIVSILFVFSLSACSRVSETEKAINRIGTVTITSLEAIEEAEYLFNQLGDRQSKVYNADELKAARAEYTRLENLITAYDQAISAIGTVTVNSKDAIDAAESAYVALEPDNLQKYVSDTALLIAKEQYAAAVLNSRYDEIVQKYQGGFFADALRSAEAFNDEFPDHGYTSELTDIIDRSLIAVTSEAISHNRLEYAYLLLNKVSETGSSLPEYNGISTLLNSKLDPLRPKNGKILHKGLGTSYCELTIEASGSDACIKVESVDNPNNYLLFYVHAHSQCTVSVPAGSYLFKYTTGPAWFGEEVMFGQFGSYSQSNDPLTFEIKYSGNTVQYTTSTITLYTVLGGNFDTDHISADQF